MISLTDLVDEKKYADTAKNRSLGRVGKDWGAGKGGGEPEDKPFGGDTGKDADYGQPEDEGPKELEKGAKVTASWTGVTGDEQSIPDGEIEGVKYKEDGTVDSYNIRWNNGNNLINLSADKVKGEEPKEKRPGGKQAEDDYHKADQMMTKYAGRDIPKAKYWAKKKKQAADAMMGRTGKELGEIKVRESLLKENPAVAAAAAMATIKLMNPQTGRPNKAITALRNKDNPSHGKAVGIFQKLKNKFKKSDFDKEKDKVAKGADDWVKKQSQSDADFYKKQYAARTGKELGEDKMNERVDFHTITGNKRFMTKTALPILRKYGAKNVKVNLVAGDYLEVRFPIDSNKLKKLDKELKRKNKTAYGGIVENRRDKMKEAILRKVIREEIKKVIKEDEEAFSQPIPATIDRYMKKFIDAVARGNLNRKRKLAILGRTIVALQLDPQEVSKYARLVKREL